MLAETWGKVVSRASVSRVRQSRIWLCMCLPATLIQRHYYSHSRQALAQTTLHMSPESPFCTISFMCACHRKVPAAFPKYVDDLWEDFSDATISTGGCLEADHVEFNEATRRSLFITSICSGVSAAFSGL